MARSGPSWFETLPPEIIVQIFQCCNTAGDLIALASTCRFLHGVWQANTAAALWPVLLREIPLLPDALLAARMTQLVVDAELRDEVPPIGFSPRRLKRPVQPSLKELRASLDLHRLSRGFAESFFCGWAPYNTTGMGYYYHPDESGWVEKPARKPKWMGRMCDTILKVFTLGAALAGAYNEPLLKAKNHPDPEIKALACQQWAAYNWDCVKGKGVRFLTQFAVYNLEASLEAQDAVFGPAAVWLLESILSDRESRQAMAKRFEQGFGRAGYCASLGGKSGHCPVGLVDNGGGGGRSHSDTHLVVWQLMRMLWVFEQIRPHGWGPLWELFGRPMQPLSPCRRNHVAENGTMPCTSAVAILCGSYRAQEVTYLAEPCDHIIRGEIWPRGIGYWEYGGWDSMPLVACPVAKYDEPRRDQDEFGTEYGPSPFIERFLELAFRHSGRANFSEETGAPVAPLGIKFFEYFLRRHLGLRFRPCAFRSELIDWPSLRWTRTAYEKFAQCMTLFADDSVGYRRAFRDSSNNLGSELYRADFLDGSEMLTAYEPERRYYSDEELPRDQGWA